MSSETTRPMLMKLGRSFQQTTCCVCSQLPGFGSQRSNSNRASITRIKTPHYLRTYPSVLVLPDGSSITIRYEKPRKILKLPVDLSALTEKEKELRKTVFNKPKKIQTKREVKDSFDVAKYAAMIKKKKT